MYGLFWMFYNRIYSPLWILFNQYLHSDRTGSSVKWSSKNYDATLGPVNWGHVYPESSYKITHQPLLLITKQFLVLTKLAFLEKQIWLSRFFSFQFKGRFPRHNDEYGERSNDDFDFYENDDAENMVDFIDYSHSKRPSI